MIINGVEMDGSMKAAIVLTIFSLENIRNIGIMIAANGTIIAVSRIANTISFAFVMINFKAVAGEGADQQTENRKHGRVPERIPECTGQILIRNQCFKILHKIRTRNQFSSGLHPRSCSSPRTPCSTAGRRTAARQMVRNNIHCRSFFLCSSLITYFHLDQGQDSHHYKDHDGHCCRITEVRALYKGCIINIMGHGHR